MWIAFLLFAAFWLPFVLALAPSLPDEEDAPDDAEDEEDDAEPLDDEGEEEDITAAAEEGRKDALLPESGLCGTGTGSAMGGAFTRRTFRL